MQDHVHHRTRSLVDELVGVEAELLPFSGCFILLLGSIDFTGFPRISIAFEESGPLDAGAVRVENQVRHKCRKIVELADEKVLKV
jgi:hypothetical protein